LYTCGHRKLNEISPDGGAPDTSYYFHLWLPIPVKGAGKHILQATDSNAWISGIAFGKNMWGHARNSAVSYHWSHNGTDGGIAWNTHDWNNDNLAMLNAGRSYKLRVPVIPNGKDKLLYIVEHNNNWTGTMHGNVTVNDHPATRFSTAYKNPFSTHFNSKSFDRYIATRVSKNLIRNEDSFITFTIDMTNANNNIHFREIGTHDAY